MVINMTKRRTHRQHSSAPQRICSVCNSAQSFTSCNCTTPAVLLCSNCAPAHAAIGGSHSINSLSSVKNESPSISCSQCDSLDIDLVCCCVHPPVPVCQNCMAMHVSRPPYGLHIPIPMHVKEWVGTAESIETLRKRQVGKEQARHILAQNLMRVSDAEEEIRTQCKWLVTAIKEEMDDALSKLWKIREDLTTAIDSAMKEVEDHVYEENYHPSNFLVSTIWNFHLLPVESELCLFSFKVDIESAKKKVKDMIYLGSNTMQFPSAPGFIPIVSSTSLRKFYYQTENISPPLTLSSSIKIDMTSAWVFLEDGKVFCCGRHSPPSDCTYLIDSTSAYVEQLDSMLVPRSQHGIIQYGDSIYVFGGLGKTYMKSCEEYRFQTKMWRTIPDMKEARDGFNPCLHNEAVYLIGGSNASTAEQFIPQTETFLLLNIALPKADCSIALIEGDEIVVLQRDAVYRWKLNSNERTFRETRLTGSPSWSNCSPVVMKN